MKCSKCGAEIPANSLYCMECGEDIHIVPDFEPEIELNLEATLNSIVEEFQSESEKVGEAEAEIPKTPKHQKCRKNPADKPDMIFLPMSLFAGMIMIIFVILGIVLFQYNSFDHQLKKAQQFIKAEQYDKAIERYKRALEIRNDIDIKFLLSDAYFRLNNKVEYEYILRDIATDPSANTEQLESVYGKLIAIYRSREDYDTIADILNSNENEVIRNKFHNYLADKPEFSLEEGSYASMQPLKLSSVAAGNIYFTTDGSQPTKDSILYSAPILLDEGDHIIRACFVNEYGVASDCVTRSYHIDVEELPMPAVSEMSGEYIHPVDIEILDDIENIYYTTDGSDPTTSSNIYTEPIPLPLGESQFKFVRIEDGKSSSVVERNYRFKLHTSVSVQDAEWSVITYSMENGKIQDAEGHLPSGTNDNEMYKYQLQYVKNINGVDDFYVIAEVYYGTDGSRTRTGNYFAVNAYNNKLYRLQIDSLANFYLVEINE